VKVRRFIAGMSYDAFATDELTQDAVIRNLEIIGEAAGRAAEGGHEEKPADQVAAHQRVV
jgi:uncharacterized protein with HEPN domain